MAFRKKLSSGIKRVPLLFLCLSIITIVLATTSESVHASQALSGNAPLEGTLNIIAVMVEFQPDDNRFTSGNGTFEQGAIPYLETPGTPIDALPHNRSYFEAHLEFVSNYYQSMSDSRLSIEYTVLPDVYTLPETMDFYSPTGPDPELSPVAAMVRDVWTVVGEAGDLPIVTLTRDGVQTAFVIFHAGIGRDVELTGTTLDRTPQDIPSVYLNRDALSSLLDDPTFTGFSIDSGDLLVDNSLIIPRTQTRAGTDVTGNRFLVPLSINGLLAAQIGSHLGLPYLFNTETGESGIGRFGLMDGASIFAYNGLFPPSLSAWEKIRLGWAEPQELTYEIPGIITVPADTPAGEEDIYKVPISSGEYFLVENRHRNPSGNGITLTIRRPDGSLASQSFTNNDEAFVNQQSGFDELLEPGVVVDVSHFDFALPGGLDRSNPDTQEPVELNGGILIWHIDEAVIRINEPDNAINNNPDRRGVMLVEADGAQDIGRRVSVGLSENPVNGSPYDFWWSGNNATVVTAGGSISLYQNRFGPDTTPDNSSHSGSPSPFELFNFTDNQIVASFEIRPANPFPDLYRLIDSIDDLPLDVGVFSLDEYYSSYRLAVMPFRQNDNSRFLIPALDGYLLYDPVAAEIIGSPIQLSSTVQPVIFDSGNGLAVSEKPAGQPNSGILSIFDLSASTPILESEIQLQERPVWLSVSNNRILDLGGTLSRYDLLAEQLTEDENGIVRRSAEVDNHQASINGQSLILSFPGGTETFNIDAQEEFSRLHPGVIRTGNGSIYFYLLKDSGISLFGPDDSYRSEQVIHSGESYNRPAIADIDGDGLPDFLFSDLERNILAGVNLKGTTLSGFPVQAPEGYRFLGTPLVADIDSDGFQNLIIPAKNRYSTILLSYNQDGTPSEGFPLTVGPVSEQDTDPMNPAIIGTYLAALSDSGDLKIWQFENMTNVLWPSMYGTGTDNKISAFISDADTEEPSFTLLNKEETYNWPNPARNETYLRYQTRVASEISITITTMSGRSVYSDTILSRGGLPEELRIDTSGWASGAYFARIIASAGQQKESKTISIAVVK